MSAPKSAQNSMGHFNQVVKAITKYVDEYPGNDKKNVPVPASLFGGVRVDHIQAAVEALNKEIQARSSAVGGQRVEFTRTDNGFTIHIPAP